MSRPAGIAYHEAYAAHLALPLAERTAQEIERLAKLCTLAREEEARALLAKPGYRARYAPRGHLATERKRP